MLRYFKIVSLTIAILANYSDSPYAQDKSRLIEFADKLSENREFYRAITEYLRYNSYYPNDSVVLNNLFKIAYIYEYTNHSLEAIEYYKEIGNSNKQLETYTTFKIGLLYNGLNYFHESINEIENYCDENNIVSDSLNFMNAINYVGLEEYKKASELFGTIDKKSTLINKSLIYKDLAETGESIKLKSKLIGGIYSFIPGGGYFYTNRYQTGLAAFIVNSLLIYSTLELNNEGQKGLSILSGIFSFAWYSGTFYGTFQGIDSYNKNKKLMFYKQFNF